MVIRFDLSLEDIVQFNRYHYMHSPSYKRRRAKVLLWVSILLIGGALIVPPREHISRSVIVGFSIAWVGFIGLLMRFAGPASIDRAVRLQFREGKNKGTICEHEIEINEHEIIDRTEISETRRSWQGVERIVETDAYTFMYVSAAGAHVIPKMSVITGDFDRFTAQAMEFWQAANPEAGT